MKLVTYRFDDEVEVGVLDESSTIRGVLTPGGSPATSLHELIVSCVASTTSPASLRVSDRARSLDEVQLLAPLPAPTRNIMCVGKNYHAHSAEFARSGFDASSNDAVPDHPIVFTKPHTSITGPGDPIEPHVEVTSALDYEAEVAVVIGKAGRRIAKADAWEHVWGYMLVNDVTARDLQRRHKQWFIGKSLDTFCPTGPWLVTADEIVGDAIDIECSVNGEVRQQANTADLIFDIPTLIATLSQGMELRPGDIVATGTPAGVGIGFTPPRFLAPGDRVRISSPQLGVLENSVAIPAQLAGSTQERPA